MHRILITSVLAFALLVPAIGHAQDRVESGSPPDNMRAKVIENQALGVKVHRPDGWVFNDPGKGVVALLTAAGDSQSQIEVRVSDHVKSKHSSSFFASFHANIQKSGFEKLETRDAVEYGAKKGVETEYETGNESTSYRLVIWQYHRATKAYLVVGFFSEEARDSQYADFKKVCEKLEVQ